MRPKDILQQVKDTYSAISHEFDATRDDRPWPEFQIFLKYFLGKAKVVVCRSERLPEEGRRIMHPMARLRANEGKCHFRFLDVGCGNGRLSHFLKDYPVQYVGVDNNRTMLRIAKKKNPSATFKFGEITKLPFPLHSFDTVWCIAVLHHLPTKKLRLKALKEMKRVLKPGGLFFLMVWNLWQPKYRKYIDQKTHNAKIPWKKKILRYYYAFKQNELQDLLESVGFSKMKKVKSMNNFTLIATKKL